MNPEVGRLLLILGESQVQLEPRRRWAAHHPPGFMEEVTFLFNGHRDLASHLKALEKAMEEAKQHLIQAIVYREPDHPMSWEEGQILIASIAALEGSLTSRRRAPRAACGTAEMFFLMLSEFEVGNKTKFRLYIDRYQKQKYEE